MKPLFAIVALTFLAGCASPTVVKSMKSGDEELTCGQLKNEYEESNRFIEEAEKEKGFTGGNIARGLFFWPAILGTYSNANEAIAAAETRKVNLMNIMRNKNCEGMERLSYVYPQKKVL